MDPKTDGKIPIRFIERAAMREEKRTSFTEERSLTKRAIQIKPHEASVAATEEVWLDHPSIA